MSTNQTPKKSIVTSRTENACLNSVACFHATIALKGSGLVNHPLICPNQVSWPVIVDLSYVSLYILYRKGICWRLPGGSRPIVSKTPARLEREIRTKSVQG